MKRALIVLTVIAVLTTGIFAEGSSEGAADSYTLRLSHVLPTDHQNHKTAVKFAELVKEKTGGKVNIEIFPAAQLGNEKEIIDSVAMGTLDFALCGFGEVTKRFPVSGIFDGPFVFRDREHLAQVYTSDIFWDIMADMEEVGIQMVSPGYYGTRHVTTTDTLVKTPADLNGLKLRCPDQPMFVATTKAMGATPTPMAFSEVYLALQQGVADGQENPAAAITSMKFYEVQKYLVKTGHIIYGNHIFGSTRTLSKLPQELQAAIAEAGKEVSGWWIEQSFADEDVLLKGLEDKGMTIVEPDKEAFVSAAQFIYDDYESKWGEGLLEKLRAIQ
ncbi:sialic acid TRAP transporter substrate-binding protein SiaP [Marispirochaeta aestuarii]|uniref:sialic acid TRAP transporter substrate-binding protein SiaP n=1 Tax=Marispirochaeta aestuarii TaxID=1963862 RepID=UPI002ABE1F1C|nr:sialic acid TRAP transporter substrate-binding protein SiaP [Marispirochaeta aestuarii]